MLPDTVRERNSGHEPSFGEGIIDPFRPVVFLKMFIEPCTEGTETSERPSGPSR